MEKVIKVNKVSDIYAFVDAASRYDSDILVKKGKYVVNGKSLIGIMSIDMSTGVTVEYSDESFGNFLDNFEH